MHWNPSSLRAAATRGTNPNRVFRLAVAACLGSGLACGGSGGDGTLFEPPADAVPPAAPTPVAESPTAGPLPQLRDVSDQPSGLSGASSPQDEASCAAASVEVVLPPPNPVDIVIALDNSGSMSDEAQAVEENINVNFASILERQKVDYRVILVTEHRESDRDDTALCVRSPLSSLAACPSPEPGPTDRFFHYAARVGSHNALEVLLESYDGREADEFGLAPGGWSEWVRPNSKKVFLAITDDDARDSATEFVSELTRLSPESFGAGPEALQFTWHSIVGLQERAQPSEAYQPDEPVEQERCANSVNNAGETYQELSRLTDGLRFPICQFQGYDAVFSQIADQVVESTSSPCEFEVPEPPVGRSLDLAAIEVSYRPGTGGAPRPFGQVQAAAACNADGFRVVGNTVSLCPEACNTVSADSGARVEVEFACASTPVR